jgi:hypothetical protein
MNAGWQTKTLDEACEFSNGLWKGEKEPFVKVGVIRNTNFTKDGELDDSDIAYLDVEVKKFEKRRLKFGDIILEKSGGGPVLLQQLHVGDSRKESNRVGLPVSAQAPVLGIPIRCHGRYAESLNRDSQSRR